MTVGSEGTHAQLVGQGEGFAVIGLCRFGIARIATRGDFAEQTETPRLVTALLLAPGQAQGLVCTPLSIVDPTFEQECFAEPGELHRTPDPHRAHRGRRPHDLLEKFPALLQASRQRQRVSETCEDCPGWEIPRVNNDVRALEGFDRGVVVTLCERQAADPRQGLGEREWVIGAFCDPERLQSV